MASTLLIQPGVVTRVTLNRPEARNAFNPELVDQLTAWAIGAARDDTVRVVILAGSGDVFCAGADLKWMQASAASSREENVADATRAGRMLHALDALPVPVIGRIHGAALGGGAGLVAVCDIAVAADSTIFGFTETRLGLVPAIISPYVVRRIGLSAARAWCLRASRFPAEEARRIGLVHDVVRLEDLDAAVEREVAAILETSRAAAAATKRLLADVAGRPAAGSLALTASVLAAQRASDEGQEGFAAFLEKRPPRWSPQSALRTPADDREAPADAKGDGDASRKRRST